MIGGQRIQVDDADTGCCARPGSEPTVGAMTIPDYRREPARRALQAWSGFPSGRLDRPLVLLSSVTISGGFRTGEQKLAFLRGAIEAIPDFPPSILKVMRGMPAEYAGPPLTVTSAVKGSTEFSTDRGRRQLRAWKVHARDVPKPIWVLDPATIRQTWQPGQDVREWTGTTAALQPDGCTITMFFPGGSPLWTKYPTTDVLESGGAVALIPVEIVASPPRPSTSPAIPVAISLKGYPRQVTVTLARPLGHRVLLDQVGSPVMVTPRP